MTPESLQWSTNALEELYQYLDKKNTKAFIILKNGRIAIEYYFDGFSANNPWYWASAGKTLTATAAGIAQDEGLIDINHKVSDYLGTGWTSAPLEKENLIQIKHLLSMTSGLDDSTGDNVSPENLQYVADAGTRWAYHNVYVLIQDLLEQASGQEWSTYFNSKIKNRIGMTGTWTELNNLSVYWSNARSMARFGLMIASEGKWDTDQIVPKSYVQEAVNTSQQLNLSYGYLWWLNGKASFRLPQSQMQFNGTLIPEAPLDMFCALGKNDQKIYIAPSKDLVIIRLGEVAEGENFALSNFDNELWKKINAVIP